MGIYMSLKIYKYKINYQKGGSADNTSSNNKILSENDSIDKFNLNLNGLQKSYEDRKKELQKIFEEIKALETQEIQQTQNAKKELKITEDKILTQKENNKKINEN